ncbi:MAG: hypothetical protein LBD14_00175 [Puniceicoccales bacterium]|nr:hypothetical protein [Puniceicoccales bacterium]
MKTTPAILLTLLFSALAWFLPGGNAGAQVFYFGNEHWDINNPLDKNPIDSTKAVCRSSDITLERVMGSSVVKNSKKYSEVTRIEWGISRPKVMEDAEIAVQRGDASAALAKIEPVLQFFARMRKNTPGSLWLPAASIKLDALVVLKNDAVLTEFISELEAANDGTIPSLPNRIKMAKLDQVLRRGKVEQALVEADKHIRDTLDTAFLAHLHLVKGNALLELRRYEEAMNAFLRIPVFYGTYVKYIPSAQLGAAKAFRGMDSPANRDLNLLGVSNQYLIDLITQYPLSKEAEVAKTMLPKDEREKLVRADTTLETVKKATAAESLHDDNTGVLNATIEAEPVIPLPPVSSESGDE